MTDTNDASPDVLPGTPDPAEEFHQRLRAATPIVWVTPLMVLANVAVFGLMIANGVAWMEPTIPHLLEWGANFRPLTATEEPWRLFTACFVHIGIVHLLFNMFVLADAGPLVERLLGNVSYLALYVLSGLFGSLLSAFWHTDVVSAGASGAVFGVYGGLVGFILGHAGTIPKSALRAVGKNAAIFIGFNLLYSFRPGVDMAGHIGGLVAGGALALVLPNALDRGKQHGRTLATTLAGLALVAGGLQAMPASHNAMAALDEAAKLEDQVIKRWNEALTKNQTGAMSDEQVAAMVDEELLPKWTRARELIDGSLEHDPDNKTLQLLSKYALARHEGWQLLVKGVRADNPATVQAGIRKQDQAEKLLKELQAQQ